MQGVLGRRGPFFRMAETFRPDLSTSGRDEKFSAILRLRRLPHAHTGISLRIASPYTAAHCDSATQDDTRQHATLTTRSMHNTHHCATRLTAPQHSAAALRPLAPGEYPGYHAPPAWSTRWKNVRSDLRPGLSPLASTTFHAIHAYCSPHSPNMRRASRSAHSFHCSLGGILPSAAVVHERAKAMLTTCVAGTGHRAEGRLQLLSQQ